MEARVKMRGYLLVVTAILGIAACWNPAVAQQRICQHGVCAVIHDISIVGPQPRLYKQVELHRSPASKISPVAFFVVRIEGGPEIEVSAGRTFDLQRGQRTFTVEECSPRGGGISGSFAGCGVTARFSLSSVPPPPPPPTTQAPGEKGPPIKKLGQRGPKIKKLGPFATAKNDVDVYNSPVRPRQIVGMMRAGTRAKVLDQHADGWCKLRGVAAGADGWVAQDHLTGCR